MMMMTTTARNVLLILLFTVGAVGTSFSNTVSADKNIDTLLVGYKITAPFVTSTPTGDLSGPSVWLWENIAEENELNYKYVKMPFEGLLNGLEQNEIDVCLSPLTITSKRSKTIDFTSPYYIAHASMLQREETALYKAWTFIRSFFSINFLRALGALAFVIFVFGLLIWVFERHKNVEEFDKGIKGIWDGFWWSAVTMTTVGYGDKSPKTLGGRIVSLIWMFTAIIIISGFTAGIASALTVNRIGSAHNNIQDFKKDKLGTLENSATSEWLKNNFFTNKKGYASIKELIQALDNKEIDIVAYDRPLLHSIANNDTLSQYSLIDVKYNPQFYAFGLSRELPDTIKEGINFSLLYNIEKMDWRVLRSESGLD